MISSRRARPNGAAARSLAGWQGAGSSAAGRLMVGAVIAVAGLAACTSSNVSEPPTPTEPTPSTVATRVDDRVLRIGVLLPASGEGAAIGESELAGIQAAVALAKSSGGVNGQPVDLVIRDEGSDAVAAGVSLQDLIDSKVDVIIGPASSTTAIALMPTIVRSGIAACSPSASALALDDFPDDNLFFRTIPSDSLQAEAMAEVIEQTGEISASIAYVDDGYGRPFETALEAALRRRGIEVTAAVGFAADDSEFSVEAGRVAAAGDGAIALIGDRDAGSRVLVALAQAIGDEERNIVVNDTLRQPLSIGLLSAIKSETRARILGVSPYVRSDNADLLQEIAAENPNASGLFATQAFDCANLFMIAAEQTGSTTAHMLAGVIPGLSTGGLTCASFAACKQLIGEGRNIDYDGPSGRLSIGPDGDPSSAMYDEFSFDPTGRDVSVNPLLVSSSG